MKFPKFGKKNKDGNPIELPKKSEDKKEPKFEIFGLKEKKAKREEEKRLEQERLKKEEERLRREEERRQSDARIAAERERAMKLEKERYQAREKEFADRKDLKTRIKGVSACIAILIPLGIIVTIGSIYENKAEQSTKPTESIVSGLSEVTDYVENLITESITSVTETEKETEKVQEHKPVGGGVAKPAQSSKLPKYNGKPYITLNGGQPSFSAAELTTKGYERYSPLDSLGRCRTAIASLGRETMPKPNEERGSISSIYPSGWKQAKYDSISGKYLYNRCHLIGWQLSAENANRGNLITGTKYLNISGMLPFENMVADYIKETNNHVAYRVTPVYAGNNLLASGVQIEAYSVEDDGEGICFNVYCYNVQPGISINYATGASSGNGGGMLDSGSKPAPKPKPKPQPKPTKPANPGPSYSKQEYVLNTKTKKFHNPSCGYLPDAGNRKDVKASRDDLIAQGYSPCGHCDP